MGLDRKVKGDGVDPQSMNQLPVDKTLIGPGVQEDREWDGLMFPQEDRLQEGAGYRGITGTCRRRWEASLPRTGWSNTFRISSVKAL